MEELERTRKKKFRLSNILIKIKISRIFQSSQIAYQQAAYTFLRIRKHTCVMFRVKELAR